MLQDLAALAPPAIVCVAFLVGAWALVRKELAPKRRARAKPTAGKPTRRRTNESANTPITSTAQADISQHLRFI